MSKYLINSNDIEIEEVAGTNNLKLNFTNAFNNIITNLTGKGYDDVDLNDFTETGIYYMGLNVSNLPPSVGGYMYVLVMSTGGNDLIQLGVTVETTPKLYLRSRMSDQGVVSWENWVQIGA